MSCQPHTRFRSVSAFLAILFYVITSHAIPTTLGEATWTISGSDIVGDRWDNSIITFETQVPDGLNFNLTGNFYWIGSRGQFGRENFTGTLSANNHLMLMGFELVPPTFGIVTGIYNAEVTQDGRHIVNGTWSGPGIPSNSWTAVQNSVSEPHGLLLVLSSLIALGVLRTRRIKA